MLAACQAPLERKAKAETEKTTAASAAQTDVLLSMFPALAWVWEDTPSRSSAGRSGSKHMTSASTEPLLEQELDEEEVERKWIEFEAAKRSAEGSDDAVQDWHVKPLGGGWTARHKGVAFDRFRAAPKEGSLAEAWAHKAGMGKEATFALQKFGGAANAHAMALVYAQKCQWYFDQHCADASESGPQPRVPFPESSELSELLGMLEGKALQRAQWLRDLQPGF